MANYISFSQGGRYARRQVRVIRRGSPRIGMLVRIVAASTTWIIGVLSLSLIVAGIVLCAHFITGTEPTRAAPFAVLAAAGLATLGWLVTGSNQRTLSRKQHTLNLLIQMRHAEIYNRHRQAIARLSAGPQPVTDRQLAWLTGQTKPFTPDERAFQVASLYMLNYWEFVCAAVNVGDLDAELIRRTVRQFIVGYHRKYARLIAHERATGDKLAYSHLCALADEWRSVK